MSEPFSSNWLDAAAKSLAASTLDNRLAGDLVVSLTILGGPEGDVPTVWTLQQASLRAESGSVNEPGIEMTIPWNDAMAILRGETRPTVSYMQGKLKPSGDMMALLALLELSETEAFAEWQKALAAL